MKGESKKACTILRSCLQAWCKQRHQWNELYHLCTLFITMPYRNNKEIGQRQVLSPTVLLMPETNIPTLPSSMIFSLPSNPPHAFETLPIMPKPCLLCSGCTSSFSKGACNMTEGLGKFLSFPSGTEVRLDHGFPTFLSICILTIFLVPMQAPSRNAICSDAA